MIPKYYHAYSAEIPAARSAGGAKPVELTIVVAAQKGDVWRSGLTPEFGTR